MSEMVMATRRLLSHQVSVATMIEIALYLAIPYVVLGIAWGVYHSDYLTERAKHLSTVVPAGIDTKLVAMGETIVWWPVLALLPRDLCSQSTTALPASDTVGPQPDTTARTMSVLAAMPG